MQSKSSYRFSPRGSLARFSVKTKDEIWRWMREMAAGCASLDTQSQLGQTSTYCTRTGDFYERLGTGVGVNNGCNIVD